MADPRIWKFTLQVVDVQTVTVPIGAQLLCVQMQYGSPQLWALVDTKAWPPEQRRIGIYGTGNPLPADPGKYIGTFQLSGGELVFHAFDLGPA